jgi:hypothetical protein
MSIYSYTDSFMELFKGHDGFYVENNIDVDKTKAGAKSKKKIKSEAYFKKYPVTESLYQGHLNGYKGLGVCPINEDSMCRFGCIDIDNYSKSFTGLITAIYDNKLPLFPCRSKSGGLHIYLLLKKDVQAKSLIQELEKVILLLGLRVTFGDEHVETFPKQAKLSPGTQGNCITIPYFNAEDPISWLISPTMEIIPAEEAVEKMYKGRTTITQLSDALDELELSDAPCCVQTIIVTSALGKDSGRNNFLFTAAVFLKKKFGEGLQDKLVEFNRRLPDPVDDAELAQIYNSVKNKEYNYKCKDIPCRSYCDRARCAKRDFGVGKDKGHFTGMDYGKIVRVKSEEPYYIWDLKHMEDEDYTPITFKDETSIMDQRYFAKLCIRFLNHVPFRMQDNDWYKVLNQVLKTVEDKEVPKATDTSEKAVIRETFVKYLTQKQAGMNMPVQVKMGFVYLRDGKYYFTHRGFEMFLETERVKVGSENLRELLINYGATNDKLVYSNKAGASVEVACWSKPVDAELKEIEEYYSDVFEADADIIEAAGVTLEESEDEEDVENMF